MNLNENLKDSAARFPNRTAYTFLNESTTYAELDSFVDSAASGLSAGGIKKEIE